MATKVEPPIAITPMITKTHLGGSHLFMVSTGLLE